MSHLDLDALERLVAACEADFLSEATECAETRDGDDEPVAKGGHGDSAITFGHVRAARRTIDDFHAGSTAVSQAVHDVIRERKRQVVEEGFTAEHDDAHPKWSLAKAAASYLLHWLADPSTGWVGYWCYRLSRALWPWAADWFKPTGPRRDFVKAAALLIADIEKRDRAEARRKAEVGT